MKDYGQFCPVAKAAKLFCERWTALILRDLGAGPLRFSELQRGVPLMSPSLLSRRLKDLEAEGVVVRWPVAGGSLYALTEAGQDFLPAVQTLAVCGQRWSRRQLEAGEIDLGLAIWMLERGVDPQAFGAKRHVLAMTLSDQRAKARDWWFVSEAGTSELCLEDPGHGIDLYLTLSLPDLIYIRRGDLPLKEALESGRLDAHGPSRLIRRLGAWFNLGPHTKIASRRQAA